jgi:hypothetical protein
MSDPEALQCRHAPDLPSLVGTTDRMRELNVLVGPLPNALREASVDQQVRWNRTREAA